jgi:hypothetical protein
MLLEAAAVYSCRRAAMGVQGSYAINNDARYAGGPVKASPLCKGDSAPGEGRHSNDLVAL